MSPTPEEAKRYGMALAAINHGVEAHHDFQGKYRAYFLEPMWPPKWFNSATAALAAAPIDLGLEPVKLIPDGTFTRDDLRRAESEALDMLYPSVIPTGDGSNWEEQCEKRRLFLAHVDRIAERLWSVAGSTLSSSPKETTAVDAKDRAGHLKVLQDLLNGAAERRRDTAKDKAHLLKWGHTEEAALSRESLEESSADVAALSYAIAALRAMQPTANTEALAILDRWEYHMDHPNKTAPLELHHADIWALRAALGGSVAEELDSEMEITEKAAMEAIQRGDGHKVRFNSNVVMDLITQAKMPRGDKVFRNVVGVMLKEMELFLSAYPEAEQQEKGPAMIRRWMEMIEVAADPEQKEEKS